MLFRTADLEAIAAQSRTLAFRRWRRPAAVAGRTVTTRIGLVAIDAVEEIACESPTEAEAKAAGFSSLAALQAMFAAGQGRCYRIRLHYAGPDPRLALASQAELTPAEREQLQARLDRLDRLSRHGAWTRATLASIAERPGVASSLLADLLDRDRLALKTDIRKLKALGLTESLETGYRLSARGRAFLADPR